MVGLCVKGTLWWFAAYRIWLPLGGAVPPGWARPRCDSTKIRKIKDTVDTLCKGFSSSTDHETQAGFHRAGKGSGKGRAGRGSGVRRGEEAGGPTRVCCGLRSQMVQGTPDTPLPSDSSLSASCQIPHHGGDCTQRSSPTCAFTSSLLLSPTPSHSQLSPGGTRQLPSQFPQLSHAPSLLPSPSDVCQSDC